MVGQGWSPEVRAAVLGPTTLDGASLTKRQRPIVAALVFHGSRGASAGELIDAVWCDESIPRASRQSLHNQITRLRNQFGPEVIETDRGSYRIGRPSDAGEFERSVAPWVSRPGCPEAIAPLEHGLDLWRGTPYQDLLDVPVVEPERTRLIELGLQAAEHLALCRLTAGDLRRATTELAALVEEEPYREHRWTLLMLALHLDGRRTDALAAFEQASARLADGLGVRPSSALLDLRSRIDADVAIELVDWVPVEESAPPPTCRRRSTRHRRCGHVVTDPPQ